MEASNIFSFGSFKVWSEINLLNANNIKKLESNKLGWFKTEGKKIKNKNEKKIAKLLSLVNPFFFVIKLMIKREANKCRIIRNK